MCGILGVWGFEPPFLSDGEFNCFVDSLSHRGPDGRGVYQDPIQPLRLGHRRLSILDLTSNSNQPIPDANNRYWITHNGEVYNFLELRQELSNLGHTFYSHSDTEVILASYIEWGEECQNKFNGMWAFAIWDSKKKILFLSRDRFGVKPLNYYFNDTQFAFASETKAFLALPKVPIQFDHQVISDTLLNTCSLESREHTLIVGVKKLQAGCCAIIRDRSITIKQWWRTCDHLMEIPKNYTSQVELFKELFIDACRIRMRSDTPIGTALSGGLDSSAVLTTISHIACDQSFNHDRLSINWKHAFCASYHNTSQDETQYAKQVIDNIGIPGHFFSIDVPELINNFDQALFDFEDIFELPIGPWLLYREFRRKNIIVSIDGHGADELFGGYHHHIEIAMAEALFQKGNLSQFIALRKMYKDLFPIGSPVPPRNVLFLIKNALKRSPHYHHIKNLLAKLYSTRGKRSHLHWLNSPPSIPIQSMHTHSGLISGVNKLLYSDFHHQTLPTILRNFDRCSMSHGVEVRAPFLDYRLVCLAFSITNTQSKIGHGYTKRIIRDAMKHLIPESIRLRKSKVGFASPLVEWFGKGLKPFVLDQVNSQSFLTSPIWKGKVIRNYVETCYNNNDFYNARRCFEFIQTNLLIQSFNKKRTSYRL